MGLQLDLVSQISNVKWGGVVFVFGGFATDAGKGSIYYVNANDKSSAPKVTTIAMPRGFECIGSSFHRVAPDEDENGSPQATFLMCGNEFKLIATSEGGTRAVFYSMIYMSRDGLEWTQVREEAGTGEPPTDTSNNPMALVWNDGKKSFFYDQLKSIGDGIGGYNTFDQILGSSDGLSWTRISSTDTSGVDPSGYRSKYSDTYCAENDCLDEQGNHVPDGIMHNENDKVTMQPEKPPISDYATGLHSFNSSSGGATYGSDKIKIKITKIDEDGTETTTESTVPIPGIKKVMCVGGGGDVWMVGGFKGLGFDDGGAVAMTTDRGETWNSVIRTPQPILTLTAGQVGTANAGL
jgi:hypothetical protein